MEKRKLKAIVLTALLTTLFWVVVQEVASNYVRKTIAAEAAQESEQVEPDAVMDNASGQTAPATGNLAKDIVGTWEPVETARYSIEFSRFGKMIIHNYGSEYVYKVSGGKLKYHSSIELVEYETPRRIEIETIDGVTYLNLYDDADYAGRYKKVK